MLTRTDANWQIKLVLSSYTFIELYGAFSFPDGNSDCSRCTAPECYAICKKNMPYSKAHRDDVCGYTCIENGQWKSGVYTRVHRDFRIIKALRQFMGLPTNVTPTDVGLPPNCE
jgi:alpha-amylase